MLQAEPEVKPEQKPTGRPGRETECPEWQQGVCGMGSQTRRGEKVEWRAGSSTCRDFLSSGGA